MKTSSLIHKSESGWYLEISIDYGDKTVFTRIHESKLIEVINTANLLKLHIDNEESLPIKQYLKQMT